MPSFEQAVEGLYKNAKVWVEKRGCEAGEGKVLEVDPATATIVIRREASGTSPGIGRLYFFEGDSLFQAGWRVVYKRGDKKEFSKHEEPILVRKL